MPKASKKHSATIRRKSEPDEAARAVSNGLASSWKATTPEHAQDRQEWQKTQARISDLHGKLKLLDDRQLDLMLAKTGAPDPRLKILREAHQSAIELRKANPSYRPVPSLGKSVQKSIRQLLEWYRIDPAAPDSNASHATRKPLAGLQIDVWEILQSTAVYDQHGMPKTCLTGDEIADRLDQKGIRNQTGKSIGDVIAAMRKKGWTIENQQGQGYFIPKQ